MRKLVFGLAAFGGNRGRRLARLGFVGNHPLRPITRLLRRLLAADPAALPVGTHLGLRFLSFAGAHPVAAATGIGPGAISLSRQ